MATLYHMLWMRVSENNGLPWTQTQEYIEFCRTASQPGDATAYSKQSCEFYRTTADLATDPVHPKGQSPSDVTQFQVG